jgi:hypothetical protein
MTSTILLTLHLLNLKSQSFEMAEKSGFEALKTGLALLKKGTFSEKVEQRAVIKFCGLACYVVFLPCSGCEFLLIFKSTEYNYLSMYCDKILYN